MEVWYSILLMFQLFLAFENSSHISSLNGKASFVAKFTWRKNCLSTDYDIETSHSIPLSSFILLVHSINESRLVRLLLYYMRAELVLTVPTVQGRLLLKYFNCFTKFVWFLRQFSQRSLINRFATNFLNTISFWCDS